MSWIRGVESHLRFAPAGFQTGLHALHAALHFQSGGAGATRRFVDDPGGFEQLSE